MANISFTTNNQIIRDLYDTAQEAFEASKALGCDGYRTYLINGETKYVPCSSFVQYENALRYRTIQGKIGAFGSDTFGDKLVGFQFASADSQNEIQGDPFFTLGNFSLQKSLPQNLTTNPVNTFQEPTQNDAIKKFTVESIANRNLPIFEGKPYIETLRQKVNQNINVKVLFDKRKLDNYVLFSSLKERFKNVIIEIFNNYPGAIRIEPISITSPSVTNYVNYPFDDKSEFKCNLFSLNNPFEVKITRPDLNSVDDENITIYRNFAKTYSDYVVSHNGVEYPILDVRLPETLNDDVTGLRLTIQGNPFGNFVNQSGAANIRYYIKPKKSIYNNFYSNLTDLSGFLLNKDNEGNFVSDFLYPIIDENGKLVTVKETLNFPVLDDFNIDMFGDNFDVFTTKLNDFAESYDSVKTNLISRFLTTDSLKEFDTEDRKVNMLFQLYGKTFDDVKKYIDGITFMRNVSYDKIENIPDLLIKNYATMLGLRTYDIEDEETLIESLFSTELDDVEKSTTPAEIDIELWRRILINSFYLYKSKGTRKSIEFILKLVGLPDEIFELNEYVYLADTPLNSVDVLNKIYNNSTIDDPETLIQNVPFDIDGFPTKPLRIKFQENGNFLREDKNNVGLYDFGKSYINAFRKFDKVNLFNLQKTVDNVKSWVYSETPVNHFKDTKNSYTNYTINHSNLLVNSKELEIYLSTGRIFDVALYRQYVRNIGMVNADLNFDAKFDSTNLSFNQFLKQSLNNFINPKNRKTIITYPTLSKVYYDYLKTTNTPIDGGRALEFLNKFDSSWVRLIEQFLPATSIVNAGKKAQNSQFLDNKFRYKHGLNDDLSWLGTDSSEFQNKALKPVYLGTTTPVKNVAKINNTIQGESLTFDINGNLGTKLVGQDPTINEYFGVYYSMFEYCDEELGKFFIWQSGVDYGDDSVFGGNINQSNYDTTTPRFGIFAIYDNSIYRLNTRYIFDGIGTPIIDTAGINSTEFTRLPPNKATLTFSGVTLNLWEKIPIDADARSITFDDTTPISGSTTPIRDDEREFYMTSIGRGLAYLKMNVDFDCPPPKPHVCYYDFDGRDVTMTLNTYKTYTDEDGIQQTIRQPKLFGFSKDYSPYRPTNLAYGKSYNWSTKYKKRFSWVESFVYFKDEIIANIDPTNKEKLVANSDVYIVTGDTFTATGSTYPVSTPSGLQVIATATPSGVIDSTTMSSGTPGGLYESYEERTKTDPFMHVDPSFIAKIKLNPNREYHSINLTKSLNLSHIFSGQTADTTYKVKDNIVDGELFISDSITVNFDGFYEMDDKTVGPFYTLNDESTFIHTLDDSLLLQPNRDNVISIQSLNENFQIVGNDLNLANTNPGYYLVTKSSFISLEFNLYFESIQNVNQTVQIKLVNSLGFVYETQEFTFNGENLPNLRQYSYQYSGFFNAGERIYLVINPIDLPCTLSRYEEIDYIHQDLDESSFTQINDPRFRVLFNSGFSSSGEYLDGYSIKPIYNINDLNVKNLILRTNENYYVNVPMLNVEHSIDENYLYNKLYLQYFQKNAQSDVVFNTTVYDKVINFDKVNFKFKVRSKSDNFSTSGANTLNIGVKTAKVEYELSFSDYYIGGSVNQTDYNDVTTALSIGKAINERRTTYNREFTYSPKYSFYGGTQLGSNEVNTLGSFTTLESGLNDYTNFNYGINLITELKKYKRYSTGILGTNRYNLYKLENDIYETEIYQNILDVVPEFNSQIVNYELNDIVKVPIDNYKIVVDGSTGKTVEEVSVYRLYVCVNDIHENHCYKIVDANSVQTQGEIHEIYRPRGSRSCFVEIEKYNPSNFTPWGYEHFSLQTTNNPNYIDYVYRNYIAYDPTENNEYKFGDLILADLPTSLGGETEFFRFIYQKPLNWDSTKQYYRGDFVVSGVTDEAGVAPVVYRFFIARRDNKNQNPTLAVNNTPTDYWARITDDSVLFDHKSLIGVSGLVDSISISWLPNLDDFTAYSTTSARLPKTLPVSDFGIPLIATGTTVSGVTFNNRWDSVLKTDYCFIDNTHRTIGNYDVSVAKKLLRANSFDDGRYYGSDMIIPSDLPYDAYDNTVVYAPGDVVLQNGLPYRKLTVTGSNVTPVYGDDWVVDQKLLFISNELSETDNYVDYYLQNRTDKTNILLSPSVPFNAKDKNSIFRVPYITDTSHVYPLFERMGRINEKNNPNLYVFTSDYSGGATYDSSSQYLGDKYAVNRGVLYRFISQTSGVYPSVTNTLQPFEDTTNWVENDFCLVNNFKYYKDRTRVVVYESQIQSLTDSVKNNLYFFNPNLTIKNGFTNRSFSGSTINNQLVTAADKFYDISDSNRVAPAQRGNVDFRVVGSDIIMDYYPIKDNVGYPLTGEFMGQLKVSNPCGHTAVTYFGVLFDVDVNDLDRENRLSENAVFSSELVEILPYVVRVVVTQNGESTANLTIKQLDSTLTEITQTSSITKTKPFDQKFNVIPQTDFNFEITYSINRKQTKFKSAFVDSNPLFLNDDLINTNTIQTNLVKTQTQETRTIRLKNITANKTIFLNLDGIVSLTDVNSDVADPTSVFDIKSINIDAIIL